MHDREHDSTSRVHIFLHGTLPWRIVPARPIQLVCFDIGGVLVRICRSWEEGCHAAGLPLRDGAMKILKREFQARRRLVNLYQTGKMDTDEYCRRVSETIEGRYDSGEIRAIHDAWLLEEYEGMSDVIDAIHEAGVKTAALSNINAVHWERLDEFPAVSRLHHRFGSHLIGHHKPQPEIYRVLESSLNVSGADILFFDDLLENVDAARAIGWRAVHVDHEAPMVAQVRTALVEHNVLGE